MATHLGYDTAHAATIIGIAVFGLLFFAFHNLIFAVPALFLRSLRFVSIGLALYSPVRFTSTFRKSSHLI